MLLLDQVNAALEREAAPLVETLVRAERSLHFGRDLHSAARYALHE